MQYFTKSAKQFPCVWATNTQHRQFLGVDVWVHFMCYVFIKILYELGISAKQNKSNKIKIFNDEIFKLSLCYPLPLVSHKWYALCSKCSFLCTSYHPQPMHLKSSIRFVKKHWDYSIFGRKFSIIVAFQMLFTSF